MDLTIEPYNGVGGRTHIGVYRHDTYPESSVLAGQSRRVFLAGFDTVEAARLEYPGATVLEHSTRLYRGGTLEEISGLPASPPDWYDAAACGEEW